MDISQVGLLKCKVNYIKFFNLVNFVILAFVAIYTEQCYFESHNRKCTAIVPGLTLSCEERRATEKAIV